MSLPVASVIVPAYNSEHSIDACLWSLAHQSELSIEVLVIDDGSTDGTPDIISDWIKRDARFRSWRIPNSGLSAARNAGLAMARGQYVMFLDSDDWCEPFTVEASLQAALADSSEVVVSGAIVDHLAANGLLTSRNVSKPPRATVGAHDTRGSLPRTQAFANLLGFAWNKLYDRSFLERSSILFRNTLPGYEDIQFNARAFSEAGRISFIDVAHVHYVQHQADRLSMDFRNDWLAGRVKDSEALEIALQRLHWTIEERADLRRELLCSALYRYVRELTQSPDYDRCQRVAALRKSRDSSNLSALKSLLTGPSSGLKHRLIYLLLIVAPAHISLLLVKIANENLTLRKLWPRRKNG